ncbi:MAG TPA: xanthine dehydrogenase family protein molybdopterin-binding subunit [Caulobacteraceae bacterium]|nr:xanthine dehydrogenase family protein molybdopterin-binding subunit [Caulobacteraceae bacterium]
MEGPHSPYVPPSSEGPSRREVVASATLSGGVLLVGCSPATLLSLGAPGTDFGPFGPFIRIDPEGAVTVVDKHVEVGQGSHAALCALVCEELGADFDKVKWVEAPAIAKVYANSSMGVQGTGGSSAVSNSWTQLRKAGAAARAMFVQAAAERWDVPAGRIDIENGVVSHPSGRRAGLGELVAAASRVTPPKDPPLKDPSRFTLVGTSRVRRKDSALKATGAARYTQDVHLPNMLTAMVAHSPRFGGKVKSFDARAARQVPGVVDIFAIPTGVAVVARDTYSARKGREALTVAWDDSKAETRGSDALFARAHAIAAGRITPSGDEAWQVFLGRGGPAPAGARIIEASYDFPFLAHAAMEPMNCVAEVGGGKTKLTFGSQAPTLDQLNTAKIVGVLPGSVEVETLFAGGSFGRRANFPSDYVSECVHVAKHVGHGRPVKLVWTREDDMAAGFYRPLAHHALRVALGADGYPLHWRHRVVTPSIMKGSPVPTPKLDPSSVEGCKDSPYLKATPNVDGQVSLLETGVPVLWWRSVGATHNAFVMEHTIDQLARAAGIEPAVYRRALYRKAGFDRHLGVLDLALAKAGPVPTPGWTRGLAVHESFGSVVAQIAEVKLEGDEPRVGRVVTAIDCGIAVAPDQVAAQMEGGTCLGLAAALFGRVTMKDGHVDQTNFDGYRVLRMNEAPQVETHIVPSANAPSGVGEPGTPVIAPAVANALLAMTGKPTASQPFVSA